MKNYLILSGGGFKASFQLGAVEVLQKNGIVFDKVFGVSAGAINGAMIAQGKISKLKDFYFQLAKEGQNFVFNDSLGRFKEGKIKINLLKTILFFINRLFNNNSIKKTNSLFTSEPLYNTLIGVVDKKDFISDFYCGFISYTDGEYKLVHDKIFNTNDELVKAIVASSSIPVVLNPVESVFYKDVKNHYCIDGGIRKSSPIGDAIDIYNNSEDKDVHFYIVNCHTGYIKHDITTPSIVSTSIKTIEIMMSELFKKDLKMFLILNEFPESSKYKKFNYTLIQPDNNSLGDHLDVNHIIDNYIKGTKQALKIIHGE
jgi:NTE family protein